MIVFLSLFRLGSSSHYPTRLKKKLVVFEFGEARVCLLRSRRKDNHMLDTNGDLSYTVLHKLLRMNQTWLKLVFLVASSQNIVAAHAPSVDLITLTA